MFHIDRLYHHSLVNLVQNASFFYQLPTNSWTFSQPSKLLIGSIDEYCLDDVCFLPTVLDTAKRKKTNNENHDSLWTENQCTMKEKRLPFLAYFRWIKSFLDHKVKSIVSQFSHWIWFSLFWQKRTCKLLFIFIKSELGIWLCSKFLKGRCGVGGGGVTNLLVPLLWYYLVDIENMF